MNNKIEIPADYRQNGKNWMATYYGKKIYPLDPRPEEIDLRDIAHALSHVVRFNGHGDRQYTVGHHSILCAKEANHLGLNELVQLHLLLHDASEAYICDVPRPIKPFLQGYMEIEERMMNVIYEALEIPLPTNEEKELIKTVDNILLQNEAYSLTNGDWYDKYMVFDHIKFYELSPKVIKYSFLTRFEHLKEQCKIKNLL